MTATRRHPGDADLIRALDRQSERAQRHVQQCESCARRMQRLERQFQAVSRQLVAADQPVRFTPVTPANLPVRDRTWLRAAMFTLLLTGTGAMAWAAYQLMNHDAAVVTAPEILTAPAATTSAAPANVSFLAVADSLVVRVSSRQQSGALYIAQHDNDSVTVAAPAAVPLRVSERGVDILNRSGARGDYRITVPRGVRRVLLLIGDQTVRVDSEMLQRGEVLPLTTGG